MNLWDFSKFIAECNKAGEGFEGFFIEVEKEVNMIIDNEINESEVISSSPGMTL
jgi:hypothetical protein